MPSVNPGPATTANANTLLELAPVNATVSSLPLGTNALRCLAVARAINIINATGDIAVVPLINCFSFIPQNIYFTNALNAAGASASAAALTVSVNGGAAVTGTSLVASVALANLTGSNKFHNPASAVAANTSVQAATMGTAGVASNFIYVNSTVVSAAAATADFFYYGYDIS